jgi:hypothetical protein
MNPFLFGIQSTYISVYIQKIYNYGNKLNFLNHNQGVVGLNPAGAIQANAPCQQTVIKVSSSQKI